MYKRSTAILLTGLLMIFALQGMATGTIDILADFEDNQHNTAFSYHGALQEFKMELNRNCYKVRSNQEGQSPAGIQYSFSQPYTGKIMLQASVAYLYQGDGDYGEVFRLKNGPAETAGVKFEANNSITFGGQSLGSWNYQQWYQVVMVIDAMSPGGPADIYIDGIKKASEVSTGVSALSEAWIIPYSTTGDGRGLIDDIYITDNEVAFPEGSHPVITTYDYYADFENNSENPLFVYNGAMREFSNQNGKNVYRVRSNREGDSPAGIQKDFSDPLRGRIMFEAEVNWIYPGDQDYGEVFHVVSESGEARGVMFDKGGKIFYGDTVLGRWSHGSWYRVTMVLDTEKTGSPAEIYLDETLAATVDTGISEVKSWSIRPYSVTADGRAMMDSIRITNDETLFPKLVMKEFRYFADFAGGQLSEQYSYTGAMQETGSWFGKNAFRVRSNQKGQDTAGVGKSFAVPAKGNILLSAYVNFVYQEDGDCGEVFHITTSKGETEGVNFRADGSIIFGGTTLGSWAYQTWHKVDMLVRTQGSAHLTDIYIDGVLKAQGVETDICDIAKADIFFYSSTGNGRAMATDILMTNRPSDLPQGEKRLLCEPLPFTLGENGTEIQSMQNGLVCANIKVKNLCDTPKKVLLITKTTKQQAMDKLQAVEYEIAPNDAVALCAGVQVAQAAGTTMTAYLWEGFEGCVPLTDAWRLP